MKPEDKVPTLEQCQRLKELGVVLNTEKFWRYHIDGRQSLSLSGRPSDDPSVKVIPAPDVAELGEVFRSKHLDYFTRVTHGKNTVTCHIYDKYLQSAAIVVVEAKTEAQARCAALIWLIEHKHLKPEEVQL